ncbi:hypothetical protein K7432_012455 [Basidiobolus ranarum]|uniref:HTH myb-type domain-containing protein n=1 Tax=Basidiobolus ranarum TaxID=34480 RepID=A0ABR2VSD3_9FUNG
MSTPGSLTSLRIDKGQTRFTPKIKQRISRKPKAATKVPSASPQSSEDHIAKSELKNLVDTPIVSPQHDNIEQHEIVEETPEPEIEIASPTPISKVKVDSLSIEDKEKPTLANKGNVITPGRPLVNSEKRRRSSIAKDISKKLLKSEDSTEVTINTAQEDLSNVPLFMFCKDTKRGKPTKAFIEREKAKLEKKKKPESNEVASTENLEPIVEDSQPTTETQSSVKESFAPQMRVVNGKLILDDTSLFVEHANINSNGSTEPMDVIEESAADRYVNSGTYLRRIKSQRWTPKETEVFYQGLAKWGTDFSLIAFMLPNRTQKHIKYKFKKEEQINPSRITEALVRRNPGTPAISVEEEPTELEQATTPAPVVKQTRATRSRKVKSEKVNGESVDR